MTSAATGRAVKADDGPRTDHYGEPLPPGAVARLGSVRLRHGGRIWSVTFAPDGRSLASASEDRTARLWDVATGKELRRFVGHTSSISAVAFLAGGKTLVSVGSSTLTLGPRDRTVRVWDVASGRELRRFAEGNRWHAAVASLPDGSAIVTDGGAGYQDAELRDITTGALTRRYVGHTGAVHGLAISANGTRLATCANDGTARLWDVSSGDELRRFACVEQWVRSVALSPDAKLIAAGTMSGPVRLWDASTGELKQAIPESESENGVLAFSPDGKLLAAGGYPDIRVWEVPAGVKRHQLHVGTATDALTFSPDGGRLAAACGESVWLWDVQSGHRLLRPPGHQDIVNAVVFAPDGRTVATGSDDRTVRFWEAPGWREVYRLPFENDEAQTLAYSPRSGRLAISCQDRGNEFDVGLRVLSVTTKRQLWNVRSVDGTGDPGTRPALTYGAVFSPDGKTIALGSDRSVWLRDATTGRVVRRFTGNDEITYGYAFTPDGKALAVAGEHKTVVLWDLATGRELRRFCPQRLAYGSIVFSPDGGLMAVNQGDEPIRLWDVATGRRRGELADDNNRVRGAVAFHPSGRILAAGSGTEVVLWDVVRQQSVGRLTGHDGLVLSVSFAPDGALLASGSADATVLIWDVRQAAKRGVGEP